MEENPVKINISDHAESPDTALVESSMRKPVKTLRRAKHKLTARHRNDAVQQNTNNLLLDEPEMRQGSARQVLQEFDPLHTQLPSRRLENVGGLDTDESKKDSARHVRSYAETVAAHTQTVNENDNSHDLGVMPLRTSLHEKSWPALSSIFSTRDLDNYALAQNNDSTGRGDFADNETPLPAESDTAGASPSQEKPIAWRAIIYRTVPALQNCAIPELTGDTIDEAEPARQDESLWRMFAESDLTTLAIDDLRKLPELMRYLMNEKSQQLIDLLETRERRLERMEKRCLMLTAILQAFSTKQVADSVLHFSILPREGQFFQWKRAVSVAVRLPGGIPAELRPDMWSAMADNFLNESHVHWTRLRDFAFGDVAPVDEEDNAQIIKDLHRTGYSVYNDESRSFMRDKLHNVLLAYSRWNSRTKYVQGFNTIASVLLDVFDGDEDESLKVLIYLLECVQPINYYDDDFTLLRIDARIVRELVQEHDYALWHHVRRLRCVDSVRSSNTSFSGSGGNKIKHKNPAMFDSYTMQWFLLLYASWLPIDALVRLWDVIIVYGNELMFPAAVIMWRRLKELIVPTADEPETFHQILNEVLECTQKCQPSPINIDIDDFIKEMFEIGPIDVEKLRVNLLGMLPPESCAFESDDDEDADEIDNVISEMNNSRNQLPSSSAVETRDHPLAFTADGTELTLNSPLPTPTKPRCFRSPSSSSSASKQQKNLRRRHLSNEYTYSLGKKTDEVAGGGRRRSSLHNSITVLQRAARRSWQALSQPFAAGSVTKSSTVTKNNLSDDDEDDVNIAQYNESVVSAAAARERAQSAPPPSGNDDKVIDCEFEDYRSEQLELGSLSAASSSALYGRRFAGRRAVSASAGSGVAPETFERFDEEAENSNDDGIVLQSDMQIFTLLAGQKNTENNTTVSNGPGNAGKVSLFRSPPVTRKQMPNVDNNKFGDDYYYHVVENDQFTTVAEVTDDVRKLGQHYKRKVVHFEQTQRVEIPEPSGTILSDISCQTNEDLYGRQPTPWPANCQEPTDDAYNDAVENISSTEQQFAEDAATTTEGDEPLSGRIHIDAGASGDGSDNYAPKIDVAATNSSLSRRVVVIASGRRNSSSPIKAMGKKTGVNSNNAYEGDDELDYRSGGVSD